MPNETQSPPVKSLRETVATLFDENPAKLSRLIVRKTRQDLGLPIVDEEPTPEKLEIQERIEKYWKVIEDVPKDYRKAATELAVLLTAHTEPEVSNTLAKFTAKTKDAIWPVRVGHALCSISQTPDKVFIAGYVYDDYVHYLHHDSGEHYESFKPWVDDYEPASEDRVQARLEHVRTKEARQAHLDALCVLFSTGFPDLT